MKATVVEIDLNWKYNDKDCVKFVTQGDPYEGREKDPRTHRLFVPYANELIEKVKKLKEGDRVEYNVDDSKWKNMVDVWKIDGSTSNPAESSGKQETKSYSNNYSDPNRSAEIARAVALKAGVELVVGMMASGTGKAIKKTMETELIGDLVIYLSKQFEPYLLGEESEEGSVDNTDPEGSQDFDQEEVKF